ncbi:MAG TPA: glycoside hydrolase family 15 protein [Bryobacteraceae bacterium]|nr:glycoside hydrolase family 15 protein [Bryobacteraceae bacterium]
MALPIENYAILGNRASAAVVGSDGSIDWLGFPRFDSPACFAALLGGPENGRWLIAPRADNARVSRRYRPGTLILETDFETADGTITLIDCMQRRGSASDVLRLVRGIKGTVPMRMELSIRFGNGEVVPWVSRLPDGRLRAVAGPDQLVLETPVEHRGENLTTVAEFQIHEGEEIPFALSWEESFRPAPESPRLKDALDEVEKEWKQWSARCNISGEYAEAVLRSLITLRALEDFETGGIVAAVTTSLPEIPGGVRNWDYRYCWLRDSTFTLYALMESGYQDEAGAWRDWLMRAVAGTPDKMQIMYGLAGERRLDEYELPHLKGYANSRPVRVGNAAARQLQLDVFGEVLDSFYQARRAGLAIAEDLWNLELLLARRLESLWREPDEGIWEVRGGPRHFTWSKVMAWVGFDRVVRTIEEFGLPGPVDEFRRARQAVREEIETRGFDRDLNSFVQSFGGKELDASLLLIPTVGFLKCDDPRVKATVARIEKCLLHDGFVARYDSRTGVDGLPGGEGVFLACSFWLVDSYILQGRHDEARRLFERLLALRNDVGLLSEEYDPAGKRLLGNFPQAFSHVALVNSALNLTRAKKPAEHRGS